MNYYTFRQSGVRYPDHKVFECTKWSGYREPIDVYTIIVRTRSISCNCYSKGKCKHIECVIEILNNDMIKDMHNYIWSYEDTWEYVDDMEYIEG